MTWKPALPRYSLTMSARRESSSIKRTLAVTTTSHPSTAVPACPRTTECHPVRDFPALFGTQHFGGVGQRLRDALARRFREPDLLGAQPLDRSTIDGGRGQERDRLAARGLRLLSQRAQIGDCGLGDAGEFPLLVRRGVELDRRVLGHAVDAIVDLRRRERPRSTI